jgi:hypothetical protein
LWVEVDSATTQPTETDIVFGPITTQLSFQGRVVTMLDNLSSLHPHYPLIPKYCNEAKDELLTLAFAMNHSVLDMVPRLQNWRWTDVTQDGQGYMLLPERMLYLESMSYTKLLTAYDPSATVLYTSVEVPAGASQNFGLYPRTTTGYPTLFHRAGSRLEFWPTATASPVDYRTAVVISGTRLDNDLVNPGDTLLMAPRLQLLAIDLAVVISMEKMGWDEGPERRNAFSQRLTTLLNIGMKERVGGKVKTRAGGSPS